LVEKLNKNKHQHFLHHSRKKRL